MVIRIGDNTLSVLAVSSISFSESIRKEPIKEKKKFLFWNIEKVKEVKEVFHEMSIFYYDEFFISKQACYGSTNRSKLEESAQEIYNKGIMIGSEKFMERPDYGKFLDEIERRNKNFIQTK
jgi:hypothetical protein